MPTEYLENLGTPSGLIATNVTGTASALTANSALTVVTNANLSGAITSVGNVTSLGSFTSAQLAAAITDETGTSKIVFSDSPQLAGIVNISNLTASTIISADASKNVVSLALATYPSLTELSYVKGVTSGIQAQIAAIPVNPSQAGNTNKVLATDGTSSSWQYAGLGAGSLGTNVVILGNPKPANLTGSQVTIIGVGSGTSLTSSERMILIGSNILPNATTHTRTIVLGDLGNNIGSSGSVAIGWLDGGAGIDGTQSILIGSGGSSTTDSVSIGAGTTALGAQSVAIGKSATSHGNYSVALGIGAESALGSVSIGKSAGQYSGSYGSYNISVGYLAHGGRGTNSLTIGASSGSGVCSGNNNTVVGADSFNGASLSTAYDNVIVGKGSGKALTTGYQNLILGVGAAASLSSGPVNIILGNGSTLTTGQNNIHLGYITGTTSGSDNIMMGQSNYGGGGNASNMVLLGSAGTNSGIGQLVGVGFGSQIEDYGCSLGYYATCATKGVVVGFQAKSTASSVALGYKAGKYSTASDEFYLNNQDRTDTAGDKAKSLMYGVFNATASSQTLAINAAVSTPYTLAVTGVATFTAAPIVSSVTASQILASGASKEVVSLSTATYPSLAELAYVKGVTSSIQTQLNAAAPPSIGTFSGSSQANGASVSGSIITFGPADATNPGMVTTGTQSLSGAKTFATTATFIDGTNGDQLRMGSISNNWYYKVGREGDAGLLTFYGTQAGASGYLFGGADGTRMTIGTTGLVTIAQSLVVTGTTQTGTIGVGVAASANYGIDIQSGATANIRIGSSGTNFTINRNGNDGLLDFLGNQGGSNIGGYRFDAPAGSRFIINEAGVDFDVRIEGDTDANLLCTDGSVDKVGIGTASPSEKLEVVGNLKVSSGSISVATAGYGLKIKEGSDARMGVATLIGGTLVVSNTSVTANTRIMLTAQDNGGTIGWLSVSARTASTSFTILSSSALDTSVVAWMLVEPA